MKDQNRIQKGMRGSGDFLTNGLTEPMIFLEVIICLDITLRLRDATCKMLQESSSIHKVSFQHYFVLIFSVPTSYMVLQRNNLFVYTNCLNLYSLARNLIHKIQLLFGHIP